MKVRFSASARRDFRAYLFHVAANKPERLNESVSGSKMSSRSTRPFLQMAAWWTFKTKAAFGASTDGAPTPFTFITDARGRYSTSCASITLPASRSNASDANA